MKRKGWIAVDFDGTLAEYDTYNGPDHCGKPIPLMVLRVKGWIDAGWEVRVFTARVASLHPQDEVDAARKAISEWCARHIGVVLKVTSEKDHEMVELWDDRAVAVVHGVPQSRSRI